MDDIASSLYPTETKHAFGVNDDSRSQTCSQSRSPGGLILPSASGLLLRSAFARSDIYAFGCVLYEMLTGKRGGPQRAVVAPPALESVVSTCLEQDPEDRWQAARDIRRTLALITQPVTGSRPRTKLG